MIAMTGYWHAILAGAAVVCIATTASAQNFTSDAAALYFTRNASNISLASLTGNPGAGNFFSSNQFDDNWHWGVEGGVKWQSPTVGLEVRGIGLDMSGDGTKHGPGAGFILIETSPRTLYTLDPAATLTSSFDSQLRGAEFNMTWLFSPAVTFYAGPRWVSIQETYTLRGVIGAIFEESTWRSENTLWGGQVGMQVDVLPLLGVNMGPFGIRGRVGIGAMHNDIQATFLDRNQGTSSRNTGDAAGSEASYLVDAGIEATYQVTKEFSLAAGYKLFYLSDISTAMGQVAALSEYDTAGRRPLGIRTDDVMYHGLTVRGAFRF